MKPVAKPKRMLRVYEVRHLARIRALSTPGSHSFSHQAEVRLRSAQVTDQSRLSGTHPITIQISSLMLSMWRKIRKTTGDWAKTSYNTFLSLKWKSFAMLKKTLICYFLFNLIKHKLLIATIKWDNLVPVKQTIQHNLSSVELDAINQFVRTKERDCLYIYCVSRLALRLLWDTWKDIRQVCVMSLFRLEVLLEGFNFNTMHAERYMWNIPVGRWLNRCCSFIPQVLNPEVWNVSEGSN